jgi:hypothetical protein
LATEAAEAISSMRTDAYGAAAKSRTAASTIRCRRAADEGDCDTLLMPLADLNSRVQYEPVGSVMVLGPWPQGVIAGMSGRGGLNFRNRPGEQGRALRDAGFPHGIVTRQ